jgi:hypothetical protein
LLISNIASCKNGNNSTFSPINTAVNFQHKSTVKVGGKRAFEIIYIECYTNEIFIHDIRDLNAPKRKKVINFNACRALNSAAIFN